MVKYEAKASKLMGKEQLIIFSSFLYIFRSEREYFFFINVGKFMKIFKNEMKVEASKVFFYLWINNFRSERIRRTSNWFGGALTLYLIKTKGIYFSGGIFPFDSQVEITISHFSLSFQIICVIICIKISHLYIVFQIFLSYYLSIVFVTNFKSLY